MKPAGTHVFISYRRDDAAGYAGRLEEALEAALAPQLGPGAVFRDVQDIRPGEDFVQAIEQRLQQAQAVLVLIGPRWAGVDAQGRRRIDDPADFVRLEVAAALASPARVVPVLLAGATMPAEATLPVPLQPLARRHALSLGEAHWHADVARLVDALGLTPAGAAAAFEPGPARGPARPAATVAAASPAPAGGTAPSRRIWLGAGLAAAALLVLGLAWQWHRAAPAARPSAVAAAAAPALAPWLGTWQASVRYPWGVQVDERFVLERHAGAITGSASFLGVPRGIEQAVLGPEGLRFATRTQQVMGSETRTTVHRYSAELRGDGGQVRLVLRLHSEGGFDNNPPLVIEARRVAPGP